MLIENANFPQVPRSLKRQIDRFGKNPYGEPMYRLIWGESRLDWAGGKWENDTTEAGLFKPTWVGEKQITRYHGNQLKMWILEIWTPPPCSPEKWKELFTEYIDGRSVDTLGPFPERGDYEAIVAVPYDFIELRDRWFQLMDVIKAAQKVNAAQRKAAKQEEQTRERAAWDEKVDAVLADVPSVFAEPRVVVPSNYGEGH
jgi:hypothetical protein